MDPFDEVPDTIPEDWSTDQAASDGPVRMEVRIGGPAAEVAEFLRGMFGAEA